jgi:hypothetical protein
MIAPRLGLTADKPRSRPTASEDVTTALAPDCPEQRGVVVFAYGHHDVRTRVQLAHCEHDEDRRVVSINGDEAPRVPS